MGATSAGNSVPANNTNANNNPELARAREIARRLGMISETDKQDIDVPAFMRRNAENTDNS